MPHGPFSSTFARLPILAAVLLPLALSQVGDAAPLQPNDVNTLTPIKHVIIIIGENRSFDHVFGAYVPGPGQSVSNLLSQGIIRRDGSPGPNFAKAAQFSSQVTSTFELAPSHKQPYGKLPPAMTGSAPKAAADDTGPPFLTLARAAELDTGILAPDQRLLLTGATGLPVRSVDTRIPDAAALPNGPYQLTPGIPYDAYAASPVHRFFQMWQQMDCSVTHATANNPSGCLNDLFPWVEVSVGAGSNGKPQPAGFNQQTTGEGSTSMGFYNVNDGDAAYLRELADKFTMSDNFHQSVNGGTGANHIMLGAGDAIWYSDGKGSATAPPKEQIENPNPQPGTNNYYTQDGYSGGSYVACADVNQPGVAPILRYLDALRAKPRSNCEPGHYYLVNNYNPGYFGDGTVDTKGPFTVPPSTLPTIADALHRRKVSFRYYGEGWNGYLLDPTSELYCNICNFLQYSATIMTNAAQRTEHVKDLPDLYNDIRDNSVPAVSFVKPSGTERRPSGEFEDQYLRGLCPQDRRRNPGSAGSVGRYGDLRRLRRRRWLLGFGLHPASRLLWRRTAYSLYRDLPVLDRRPRRAQLRGSCLDPEIHREELVGATRERPEPRQYAQSGRQAKQSLCAHQQPCHR